MKNWKKVAAAAATALALMASTAPNAHAITGGAADGDLHPSVGILVFYDEADGSRYRCTATLVTSTVLLTAAHCTAGTAGKSIVNFDTNIAEAAPSNMPYATDTDPANGDLTSAKGFEGTGTMTDPNNRTWYLGTAHADPAYSNFTDMKNWNDVGVVVLDTPVDGITPSQIAPIGTLDTIAKSKLSKTLFTIVGYGTEVRKAPSGPQKPTPMSYPLYRRYADAPGQKLTPQILTLNGNPNDVHGTGGSCFGDSGGPTFYNGQVVTVTSYGLNGVCRYIDGLQRVDIAGVQTWLATYGVKAG
jgi:Trypsin